MKRIAATMLLASAVIAWEQAPSAATLSNCADREVRVSDATVAEGDAGDGAWLRFVVTGNGCKMGSVAYSTTTPAGGQAWPGADFVATSGTLDWGHDDLVGTRVIEVPVLGNHIPEPDEVLWLELSGPSGLAIGDPLGVGTIVDDDSMLELSEPDCPHRGTFVCELPVVSSLPSARDTTVHFATSDVTAAAGTDYVDVPLGSITIPAGTAVAKIKIGILSRAPASSSR